MSLRFADFTPKCALALLALFSLSLATPSQNAPQSTPQTFSQENLAQNPLQNTPQNTLPNPALSSPHAPNPFKDTGEIDSSTLESYSKHIPRYNTRFDSKHNLNLNAFGGQIKINQQAKSTTQNYGGATFGYDNLVERYKIGAFASYVFNDGTNISVANTGANNRINAHTAILGGYVDFLLDSHHIHARFAQSFNFLDSSANFGKDINYSSTTNFNASYGFIFALKTQGSFIEPYAKFSLASLFAINKKEGLPDYALHSHIELGANFRQYLGNDKAYFYIMPRFRQTIGVDKYDPLLRVINVDENGEAEIMMNDKIYRSYGLLLVGLDFRLSPSVRFYLQGNAKITQNLYSYGGNLGLNIAF